MSSSERRAVKKLQRAVDYLQDRNTAGFNTEIACDILIALQMILQGDLTTTALEAVALWHPRHRGTTITELEEIVDNTIGGKA